MLRGGLDPEAIADENIACATICEWYVVHREAGGEQDAVVESILSRLARVKGAC